MIRGQKVVLVILIVIVLSVCFLGCASTVEENFRSLGESAASMLENNTLVRKFVLSSTSNPPVAEFEGWKIEPFCQAVIAKSLVGTDSFRVFISTEHLEAVTDTATALQLNLPFIDSLTIELRRDSTILTPVRLADGLEEVKSSPDIKYRRLRGPGFHYEKVVIPDRYQRIRLSYAARLLDRDTGKQLSSKRFVHDLIRSEYETYHPHWYSPNRDSVEVRDKE